MTAVTVPITSPPPRPEDDSSSTGGDQRVLLHGISWETYERLLRELGDHTSLHLTYDDGLLEIFMPGDKHERVKTVLARLIEAYSDEVGIDAEGFGSATFKREKQRKGLEPDECYYVQRIGDIAGLGRELDLDRDPPPDLAIEVDITSSSISRDSVYAVLGVPEIWRYDGERVAPFLRQPDGTYVPATASAAFPQLDFDHLNRFLAVGLAETQPAAVRAMREWLRARP